jgi:predicted transcriptional regulator
MKIEELVKKQIEVVIENNISDDLIYPSTSVNEVLKRIIGKLTPESKAEDFLFVYAELDKTIKGVATFKEIDQFINLFTDATTGQLMSELKIENKFSVKFSVTPNDSIEDALDIFNKQNVDIIIVRSQDNKYLGKIKRTKLKEWFNIMTKS